MKAMLKVLSLMLCFIALYSCGSNSSVEPAEEEVSSFTTNEDFSFFINRDGTVNLKITGKFKDGTTTAAVEERGFVYGQNSNPEANNNNTAVAVGPNPVYAHVENLPLAETFYVRGFIKYNNGSYFYGSEITINTDIDASNTRSLKMVLKPELYFQNSDGITPELNVTEIEQESPVEIGFEYSKNSDFSNSSATLDIDISGNIWVTTYSEFIEGLDPATKYYFRPYAKYADGAITNGGNSVESFTTN